MNQLSLKNQVTTKFLMWVWTEWKIDLKNQSLFSVINWIITRSLKPIGKVIKNLLKEQDFIDFYVINFILHLKINPT